MSQLLFPADETPQARYDAMGPALVVICLFAVIMIILSLVLSLRSQRRKNTGLLVLVYIATVLVCACAMFCATRYRQAGNDLYSDALLSSSDPASTAGTQPTQTSQPTEATVPPTTVPATEPLPSYDAAYTEDSDPANWNIRWEIMADGQIVDSYTRPEEISFGRSGDYFALPGICTFRGNNYRSDPSYGLATVSQETLTTAWEKGTGSLSKWTGSGWTGQPLIVRWDDQTKANMTNMYPEKQAKEDLVEVVYATLDGHVYFYDLDDGSYTRDPIDLGMPFKGSGALDPRGYPLLYVGAGDSVNGVSPKIFIVSLIDGTVLYEKSGYDSFATRTWCAFDSSPLVDGETDTLIWPGESGVLYTYKLNTSYDPAAGTISVSPDEPVKTRYATSRSNGSTYWVGYENSCVIVDRYLYVAENGGMFFCIDLNTMELVWAQDTKDDNNSTPVFEWDAETGEGYIYTAPSLHWTAKDSSGTVTIYKLNAKTGEIVWEVTRECNTISGVSGGVQASPLLGRAGTELEGLIIYPIARTPSNYNGVLLALDTKTGEIQWELSMSSYAWSSPNAFYTAEGKAYVVICDSVGKVFLISGADGQILDTLSVGANVEASPAIYENTLVVGTRGQRVYGLRIG